MGKKQQPAEALRSRIVGEGEEAPDQLLANPLNWRRHPKQQQEALEAMLRTVGWVQRVIVNRRTQHIVDGHLRVEVALRRNEPTVPVLYVDLSEDEEKVVLAAIDPIGGLAETDQAMLDDLLDGLVTGDAQLDAFLDTLRATDDDLPADAEPEAPGSLAERFLIPPFSVFNAREGWWQDRKRAWLGIGIKSELGRGENGFNAAPGGSPMVSGYGPNHERLTGIKKVSGKRLTFGSVDPAKFDGIVDTMAESGTSIFDPVICEIAYRWFCPSGGLVLDPFAGGSVRGIVAGRLGLEYVGHELRAEQVEANRAQAAEISAADAHAPRWIIGDSRGIDRTCAEVDADFVFSCPPYADLEVYSDNPADLSTLGYEEFRDAYFEIIRKACARLKPNRFACFVVGDVRDKRGNYYDFVGDTVQAFREAGLNYYNEAILVTAVGSLPIRVGKQFSASRKLGKTHQNVLVFVKGDGKKAAEACGDVDVADAMDTAGGHADDPAAKYGAVLP